MDIYFNPIQHAENIYAWIHVHTPLTLKNYELLVDSDWYYVLSLLNDRLIKQRNIEDVLDLHQYDDYDLTEMIDFSLNDFDSLFSNAKQINNTIEPFNFQDIVDKSISYADTFKILKYPEVKIDLQKLQTLKPVILNGVPISKTNHIKIRDHLPLSETVKFLHDNFAKYFDLDKIYVKGSDGKIVVDFLNKLNRNIIDYSSLTDLRIIFKNDTNILYILDKLKTNPVKIYKSSDETKINLHHNSIEKFVSSNSSNEDSSIGNNYTDNEQILLNYLNTIKSFLIINGDYDLFEIIVKEIKFSPSIHLINTILSFLDKKIDSLSKAILYCLLHKNEYAKYYFYLYCASNQKLFRPNTNKIKELLEFIASKIILKVENASLDVLLDQTPTNLDPEIYFVTASNYIFNPYTILSFIKYKTWHPLLPYFLIFSVFGKRIQNFLYNRLPITNVDITTAPYSKPRYLNDIEPDQTVFNELDIPYIYKIAQEKEDDETKKVLEIKYSDMFISI